MQNVIMRQIANCTIEQKKAVRDIRNQESVRGAMYTEHKISLDEHLEWVARIETDDRQIIFVVLLEGKMSEVKVSGVVSINSLDRLHKKSDLGIYLDENTRRTGLGSALVFSLIKFAFNDLNLAKLNCEAIASNTTALAMYKKFSFAEEGFRRSNIEKDGVRIGVYFLGLTSEDWLASRDKIYQRYKSSLEKFSISIEKPSIEKPSIEKPTIEKF